MSVSFRPLVQKLLTHIIIIIIGDRQRLADAPAPIN